MRFIFDSYTFSPVSLTAQFNYMFDDGRTFQETIVFDEAGEYDQAVLDKALFLAFVLIGTSYYKTFPVSEVSFLNHVIDGEQARFFNTVYQEGLSQFAFENDLSRDQLAHFVSSQALAGEEVHAYEGNGMIALQSGGKDSLLAATLLNKAAIDFLPWYVTSSNEHPKILDGFGNSVHVTRRLLDRGALLKAQSDGGMNGHIPVTYVLQSLALIQAILLNKDTIIVSIAHEGEEAHDWIDDLAVNHQWSKTWSAEQQFMNYVNRYVATGFCIGSPLRQYSELKVAELFVQYAWEDFGHSFSSCNVMNYQQGHSNETLGWCGECPKCANSYLLFAPFLDAVELQSLFHGKDLFAKASLEETFKGLLGIDGVMKPFECVGETDELRLAYHKAMDRGGYALLPFEVPESSFNYEQVYPAQAWAVEMLQ
jgi:UDP-N-acetyl-alpha-D-muramoyl-L-alanyl-L-glutamate epimerase